MVEQWSACLSGMQFSTRDQVSHLSLFYNYCIDNMQMMTVLTLMLVIVIDRTMTATSRAAVLRRIRQDGGSTGETFQINLSVYHYVCYLPCA